MFKDATVKGKVGPVLDLLNTAMKTYEGAEI
jgi:hypothetical protein